MERKRKIWVVVTTTGDWGVVDGNIALQKVKGEDVRWCPEIGWEPVREVPRKLLIGTPTFYQALVHFCRVGHRVHKVEGDRAEKVLQYLKEAERAYKEIKSSFPLTIKVRTECWECGRVLEEYQTTMDFEDFSWYFREDRQMALDMLKKGRMVRRVYCGC